MKTSASPPVSDPYGELGITRHASEREVKDAYRRLAARWHPDRNPHPRAAEQMARINQAYRQISQTGPSGDTAAARPASPTPRPAAPPPAPKPTAAKRQRAPEREPEPDLDTPPPRAARSWWERDWGGARWEPEGPARLPQTLRHTASLQLEQAAFGCTHELIGSVADLCNTCSGTGRLVSPRSNCKPCGGEGRVKAGNKAGWRPCGPCAGTGADRKACDACGGAGLQPEARGYHFEVRVPAGMRDGQTMLLRGQGQRGLQGAGDIELGIQIAPHPVFYFDHQQRLACRVPVDLYAALGEGLVEVPTLEGDTLSLEIAAGPLHLLESRGYPNRDGSRGTLVVQTETVMPQAHSAAQRKLLRQLAEERRSSGHIHSPVLADWQQRLGAWRKPGAKRGA